MFSEIGGVREYNFLFAAHIPISLLQQTLCGHRTPSTCEHFFFAVVRAGPLPCCATSHLALRSLLLQAHCGGGHLVVVVFFPVVFIAVSLCGSCLWVSLIRKLTRLIVDCRVSFPRLSPL